jgi:pyrimidine operon attenuation protein/uracil phosphoribosyltransferase
MNIGPKGSAACCLQAPRRAYTQVVIRQLRRTQAPNHTVTAGIKIQCIAIIEQLKKRLQLVQSIIALTNYV